VAIHPVADDNPDMSTNEPLEPQFDAIADNSAVDPDTGIPLDAADGEGEAADPADLGPDVDRAEDDPFFQAPEPAGEEDAMSVRETSADPAARAQEIGYRAAEE